MSAAERPILISICGTQRDEDGTEQTIELTTAGTLWRDGAAVCISYIETEMTGMEGVKTTFRVEDGKISMVREGALQSTISFEEGERDESLYDLGFAALLLRISTRRARARLEDSAGCLELSYSVEMERRMVASHSYKIEYHTIEERPKEGQPK